MILEHKRNIKFLPDLSLAFFSIVMIIMSYKQASCQTIEQMRCDQICLECINPEFVSILQKGRCYKECNMEMFKSLYYPCYQFEDNTLIIKNMTLTDQNIKDYLQRPLALTNFEKLRIYDFTMSNVIIENTQKSTLPFIIGIRNVYNTIISGINIINCRNLPTLIRAQSLYEIIYYQDINIYNTTFIAVQNVFQNIDGNQLKIYGVSVENSSLTMLKGDLISEENTYEQFQQSNILYQKWVSPQHISFFQQNGFQYITIEKSTFLKNTRMSLIECYDYFFSSEQQSLISKNVTNVVLSGIQAINNKNANIYIGNSKSFIVQRSTFSNNTCDNCQGTAIYSSNSNNFIIQQSIFLNNRALDGGSIYLKDCKCNTKPAICITISTSQFISNTAIASGGALLLDNSDINFEKGKVGTIFKENQAIIGGAIRFIKYLPYFFQKYSEKYLFNINYNDDRQVLVVFNNKAELWGKNIGSYPRDFKIDYQSPQEVDSDNGQNYNKLEKFQNSSILRHFSISQIRSGQTINMNVIFLDEEFFPIFIDPIKAYPPSIRVEVKEFYITVYKMDNITEIDGDYHKRYDEIKDGIFKFDNLRVYARPNTQTTITLTTNMIKIPLVDYNYDTSKTFDMRITISMRGCKQGEIYSKYNNGTILWCEPCDFGKYSLDYPKENNPKQICKLCPENTVGCMENLIILKNGNWRKDENSDLITNCYNNEENCLGQRKNNQGLCKEGHIGPLCEMCDYTGEFWGQRYIQSKKYECQACKDKGPLEIGKAVIFVLLIFSYSYVGMYTTKDMNYKIIVAQYLRRIQMISIYKSAIQDETPFYIKTFTNYIQIYSAINKINIDLIETAMETPKILAFPIDSMKDILDCTLAPYLQKNISLFKMTVGPFISVFFTVLFAIVELVTQKKGSYSSTFQNIRHGVIYYQIFFLPSNIKNIFSGLICRGVGNDSYVQSDLQIICLSSQHLQYIFSLLVNFSFVILTVLYIIFDMTCSKRDSTNTKLSYGFLQVGYKDEFFYWEFQKILVRSLIIVLVCSSSYEGKTFINTAVSILCVLLGQYILIEFKKPHDRDKFNKLENRSNGVLIIILLFNIFIKNSQNSKLESIGKIIIACIHSLFMTYMIGSVVLSKIQAKWGVEYNGFKGYLKRKYETFSYLQFETINKMRVYKNWKRLLEKYAQLKIKNLQKKQNISQPSKYFESINKKLERNERRKTILELQSQTFCSTQNVTSFNQENNVQQNIQLPDFTYLIKQKDNSLLKNDLQEENLKNNSLLNQKQEFNKQRRASNLLTHRDFNSNFTSFAYDSPKLTPLYNTKYRASRKLSTQPLI